MKKITEDLAKAFDRCIETLSLNELSRRTGIGIYTLRKFANRQTGMVRKETWEKIYPVLKPYLLTAESKAKETIPPRIGPSARRHHDLVELTSDQKILLDTFDAMSKKDQARCLNEMAAKAEAPQVCKLGSLSADENRLLGFFNALDAQSQQESLLNIVELATLEIRRHRKA